MIDILKLNAALICIRFYQPFLSSLSENAIGKKGKVKGYMTMIYKVTVEKKGLKEDVFNYDLAMIKPPPEADKKSE